MDNYEEQLNSEVKPNLPENESAKKSNPKAKRLVGIVGGSFLAMTIAVGGGAALSQFSTTVAQVPASQTTNIATAQSSSANTANNSSSNTTINAGSESDSNDANQNSRPNSGPIVVVINPNGGNSLPMNGDNNSFTTNGGNYSATGGNNFIANGGSNSTGGNTNPVNVAVVAPQGNLPNNGPNGSNNSFRPNNGPNGNNNLPPNRGGGGVQGNAPLPRNHG